MARTTNKAEDLLTFSRASTGTALTKVAYGPELFTQTTPDFLQNATASGLTVTATGTSPARASFEFSGLTVGSVYLVTCTVTGGVSLYWDNGENLAGSVQQLINPGDNLLVAASSTMHIGFKEFSPGVGAEYIFSGISVREVLYNDPTGTLKLIEHPTNKPRIEYDANGVAKGLLIEEARTNVVTYSSDVAQSAWIKRGSASSQKIATDIFGNANSASRVSIGQSGVNDFYEAAYNTVRFSVSVAVSPSFYIKTISTTGTLSVQNAINGSTVGRWLIDLSLLSTTAYEHITETHPAVTVDVPFVSNTSGHGGFLFCSNTIDIISFDIDGIQLEQGSFPTSYIPTSGAAATRSADIASVSVDKFGYNQAQGSVVVEYAPIYPYNTPYVLQIDNNTTGNRIYWQMTGANPSDLTIGSIGASTALGIVHADVFDDSSNVKIATGWANNDVASSVAGSAVITDNTFSGLASDVTQMSIGHITPTNTAQSNGHIKSINYYPTRLTNAQLQDFTATKYANIYDLLEAQNASVLFDINDKTSLRVGTDGSGTPVEGDPVGMMMDVSKTGGLTMEAKLASQPELVTNGTFDTDSEWTKGAGWTISGGQLVATSVGAYGEVNQTIILPAGYYKIQLTVSITSGDGFIRLGSAGTLGAFSTSGTFTFILQASVSATLVRVLAGAAGFTGTIDNISVKALPGYTAVSPSDAARPTLKTYNSPITSREELVSTFGWNITDGGRA